MDRDFTEKNRELIDQLGARNLAPLELLPHRNLREKLVDLVLNDVPKLADYRSSVAFTQLRQNLVETKTDDLRVVVFGGGTGLSNIIGGDCRQKGWARRPFEGLKQVFPRTSAIVCVTDDGGSTGELLKDMPVIAVGDIRHVLLSSIQLERLQKQYDLTVAEATSLAGELSTLFNYRFSGCPSSARELLEQCGMVSARVPAAIRRYVEQALTFCFSDATCRQTVQRSHCLGNLIVVSALCRRLPPGVLQREPETLANRYGDLVYAGLADCAFVFGAAPRAVEPCTATPAQLRFVYGDGVQVRGEKKSSEARRGFPIDRVHVDFCSTPYVPATLLEQIGSADILIMAPGSLYSSIIPVMQVPGIAEAVKNNRHALKLLIANLWVQEGETDRSNLDPERKFHVSDMIRAYDRNVPGGIRGLFDQILCLSLQDIPGSIIQNYAVEGKSPIYLDRDVLEKEGFETVECGFYSRAALHERQVIQHDPHVVAQTVKTLYLAEVLFDRVRVRGAKRPVVTGTEGGVQCCTATLPSHKYRRISQRLHQLIIDAGPDVVDFDVADIRDRLVEMVWYHQDIPCRHLDLVSGITCVRPEHWPRDQRWDNVFSFYEPNNSRIYLRQDRLEDSKKLEIAFLIALGQSLLGDYALEKRIEPLLDGGRTLGRVYHLKLRRADERACYFSDTELGEFLQLARMKELEPGHFTRVINDQEGFTPPGLLMGLMYAWYLDNRLASHIEYKMSILKIRQSDLIPEQIRTRQRRVGLTDFFRTTVFGKQDD